MDVSKCHIHDGPCRVPLKRSQGRPGKDIRSPLFSGSHQSDTGKSIDLSVAGLRDTYESFYVATQAKLRTLKQNQVLEKAENQALSSEIHRRITRSGRTTKDKNAAILNCFLLHLEKDLKTDVYETIIMISAGYTKAMIEVVANPINNIHLFQKGRLSTEEKRIFFNSKSPGKNSGKKEDRKGLSPEFFSP
jgi:hypothetical protein